MDSIPKDELRMLMEENQKPSLSLYMPTVKAGEEIQQNAIRFKNLLRQSEEGLAASGMRSADARDLLRPYFDMLNDGIFWERQGAGLALFLSKDVQKIYRLPLKFEERVVVNTRFMLKPLLPLLNDKGHFFLLALSINEVRVFEGWRDRIQPLEVRDLPKSLAYTLRFDVHEEHIQSHTATGPTTGGSRRGEVFHGQGSGLADEKIKKADILLYFQQIDTALQPILQPHTSEDRIPLVLAGVEYLLPIYREASSYPYISERNITGNPEGLSAKELHEQAWEILAPYFNTAQTKAAEQYQQISGMGSDRASKDIKEIVPAAYYGRVEHLFIPLDMEQWGIFDPTTGQVEIQKQAAPENIELFDFAAVHTYLNNGAVYAVPPEQIPGAALCAAVFRY